MKVILRADVDRVGKKGDLIEVSDGYARNYLVPHGLAFRASDGALDQAAAMRRARDARDARARGEAEEVARTLVPKVITITAKAGTEGRLFGSVTPTDIAVAVLEQTGIELDRRRIEVEEPIRSTGTHRATVHLHADVEFPVTVEVLGS